MKHAGIHQGARVNVRWVDAEGMSLEEARQELEQVDGVLVPGGFGSRGWEGKITACRVAREQGIPYLGICLGMHVAVSEFARHVVGLEGANSTEMDPETPYPVIDLLPEQKEVEDLGGPCASGPRQSSSRRALAREAYGEPVVNERHRHRYEVNNHFRPAWRRRGSSSRGLTRRPARRDHRAPTIPGSSPASSIRSSSRGRPGRRRSSASSSAPRCARGPPRRRRRAGPRTGLAALQLVNVPLAIWITTRTTTEIATTTRTIAQLTPASLVSVLLS